MSTGPVVQPPGKGLASVACKNPKEKGSEYEREMGTVTSLWLTKGLKDDTVTRTEGSGARFTNVGKGAPGDLTTCHPLSYPFFDKYVVECKCWRYIEMIDFIIMKGEIYEAFQNLIKQCKVCERLPFMLLKQNYKPTLVICPSRPVLAVLPIVRPFNYHLIFAEHYFMARFEDFLKVVDPESFLEESRVYLEATYA
jgi:hypothetical protein